MAASAPAKGEDKPAPPLGIYNDEGVERELTAAQRMQQAQPDKMIVLWRNGLDQGQRDARRLRGHVVRWVSTEHEGLYRG